MAIAAAVREIGGDRQEMRVVGPPRRTESERQHADGPAARDHRQDRQRIDLRVAGNFETTRRRRAARVAARRRAHPRRTDDLALAACHHALDRLAPPAAIDARKRLDVRQLAGAVARPHDFGLRLEVFAAGDREHGHIGQERHGETSELARRRAEIERARRARRLPARGTPRPRSRARRRRAPCARRRAGPAPSPGASPVARAGTGRRRP